LRVKVLTCSSALIAFTTDYFTAALFYSIVSPPLSSDCKLLQYTFNLCEVCKVFTANICRLSSTSHILTRSMDTVLGLMLSIAVLCPIRRIPNAQTAVFNLLHLTVHIVGVVKTRSE